MMKLHEKELELFKTLSESTIGERLLAYLERLSIHIKSVDTMGVDDSVESVKRAAKIIEENLIKKLQVSKSTIDKVNQDYQ